MTDKRTITGPAGYYIELDRSEVYPDDPGAGTPAMVYDSTGRYSATYWCALDTGELTAESWDAECDLELSDRVHQWLDDSQAEVDAFLYPET